MRLTVLIPLVLLQLSCAVEFPRPAQLSHIEELAGTQLFQKTFQAHGGSNLGILRNVSMELDGEWKFLITKIQPLVTDHKFRVKSKEIIFPQQNTYYANYRGPSGTKWVLRTPNSTEVYYDGVQSFDPDILMSTALTAESFYIFLLGPLALESYSQNFVQLPDKTEKGKNYYRIYAALEPGIGESSMDEIVLWLDPGTWLTKRIQITLNGYRTTVGAHVDVTYLNYKKISGYTLPSDFYERVLGPIKIDAHAWQASNIKINEEITPSTLARP